MQYILIILCPFKKSYVWYDLIIKTYWIKKSLVAWNCNWIVFHRPNCQEKQYILQINKKAYRKCPSFKKQDKKHCTELVIRLRLNSAAKSSAGVLF